MNIFIGWSGEYSNKMALVLKKWLCGLFKEINTEIRVDVCSYAQPGRIWYNELDRMLNDAIGGIFCLTQESLSSFFLPWEAAQISLRNKGFVFHYCLDVDGREIPFPLGLFHSLKANKEGTRILVQTLYKELPGDRWDDDYLMEKFEEKWPTLSANLQEIYLEGANLGHDRELKLFENSVLKYSNNYAKAVEIANKIPYINENEHFVIALCGSAAIGKSTFASHLAYALNKEKGYTVSVLPTDAFALTRSQKLERGLQGYEPESHNLIQLNRSVEKLINGMTVIFKPYQHENGELGDYKQINPARILIIEGVYSFEPMNFHRIKSSLGSKNVVGRRIYLFADIGKAQELKFAADVTKRNKSVEEAFKELSINYESYDQHIKQRYYGQAHWRINVDDYWTYKKMV